MTPSTPAFAFSQSLMPFFSACQGQNKMHKLLITKMVFNIWLVCSIFLLYSSNPMCNAFSFCHDIYTKSREQDAIKQIFQEHFLPLTIAVCAWTQWLLTFKTVRKRNDFGVLQNWKTKTIRFFNEAVPKIMYVFVHPNPLPHFWATSKLWAPGNEKNKYFVLNLFNPC